MCLYHYIRENDKYFATEIFKTKNDLNPEIMEEVFRFKNLTYNFWNPETLNRSQWIKLNIKLTQ